MLVQVGLERKSLVASFALEMLERGMSLHVRPQVGAVRESFSAVCTSKGLLARVRPHVALQEPGPAERLATDVTLVLEVVGEQVHGHRRHGHVHLTTGRALLGQLAVQAPVSLLVPAQVGRRGVCFPALVARMPLDGPGTADNFPP